jgi:hypothetical protein
MNQQLVSIANDVITEMREEGWDETDIKWSASGAILKELEHQGIIDDPSKEDMAAILALVKQCQK